MFSLACLLELNCGSCESADGKLCCPADSKLWGSAVVVAELYSLLSAGQHSLPSADSQLPQLIHSLTADSQLTQFRSSKHTRLNTADTQLATSLKRRLRREETEREQKSRVSDFFSEVWEESRSWRRLNQKKEFMEKSWRSTWSSSYRLRWTSH